MTERADVTVAVEDLRLVLYATFIYQFSPEHPVHEAHKRLREAVGVQVPEND